MLREAAVAGQFYPFESSEIKKQLGSFFSNVKQERDAAVVIAPHAGYIYSGQTAAFSYSCLKKFKTYVVLSPNHTGLGDSISIFPPGEWKTPLGKVEIDDKISAKIADDLGIGRDKVAHLGEHSIEVQLPFLQYLFGEDFKFVAITIAEHNLQELKRVGDSLLKASEEGEFGLIASSDFTHFEHFESAKSKDMQAIERIKGFDVDGFYKLVEEKRLSICGAAPIAAVLQYCIGKGLKKAYLLHYDTSATASGDKSSVVGYAAIKFCSLC